MAGKYPNSGILSKNEKMKSDKSPPYSGRAEIGGVEYWISAWVKEGQYGRFFSLSFKPKDEPLAPRTSLGPQGDPDFDDDIPF